MKSLIMLVILIGMSACDCNTKDIKSCSSRKSLIKSVGGCDSNGNCGAVLEDGTYIVNATQPVVGMKAWGDRCKAVENQ